MKIKRPAPWTCEICGEGNRKNPRRRSVQHHICYKPEILSTVCLRCHLRLHGTGRCFNHPFEKKYGPAYGPVVFAQKVLEVYSRAIPYLEEGRGRERKK